MELEFNIRDVKRRNPVLLVSAKSLLLAAIVTALQLLTVAFGINAHSPIGMSTPIFIGAGGEHEYGPTVARCDAIVNANPDILFFGDSTVLPMPVDRDDRRTTIEMLDALQPECRVEGFYGPAFTPQIFAESLDYFASRGCRPEVVVVTINVRAFSPVWYRNPRFQFAGMQIFMEHDSAWFRAFYRPLAIFGVFDLKPVGVSEFFAVVRRQVTPNPGFQRFIAAQPLENRGRLTLAFARYGVPIADTHPMLASLRAIRDHSNTVNASLVCYITPVSYEIIRDELGPEAVEITRNNVEFVDHWLRRNGIEGLNLSEALDPEFMHPLGVTASHMNATGRRRLASILSEHIQTCEQSSGD